MTTITHLASRALSFELDNDSKMTDTLSNCIVDSIGCALAGVTHPRYRELLALAPVNPSGAVLIGTNKRTEPSSACVVNGFATHVFDFDDDCYVGLHHPTTTVLPAMLATASSSCIDGRRFMTALGAGIDAQCLASLSWSDAAYEQGWWNTALLGGLGAAVASARLLGLGQHEMMHAMAAALTNAHGLKTAFGTDQKALGVGRSARAGYEAALLAQAGFTAPLNIFEATDGFLAARGLTSQGPPTADTIEATVSPLSVPGIAFKPWPVCNAGHAAIEAILELRASDKFKSHEVSSITVEVLPFVRKCLQYDRPRTPSEAQFSLPFALATAILSGGVTISDLDARNIERPDLVALMERVQVVVLDEVQGLSADISNREGARVVVRKTDGICLSSTIAIALGQTLRPLDSTGIDEKFLLNAAKTLSPRYAEQLLSSLRCLSDSLDIRRTFALCDPTACDVGR